MKKIGIRLVGIGGQGVVLSSVILGRAASVYDKKSAVQTQAYGSDMRGGDVSCELILSDNKIIYPKVIKPDILIALSQKAFDSNIDDLKLKGILITDKDLVNTQSNHFKEITHYEESFNKIGVEEFKLRTVANIIMLGYINEKVNIVSFDALKNSIINLVPPKTLEVNLKALEEGNNLAKDLG